MLQQVTVRVPASTSNLGPGFDCLGVALRLYNEITIARAPSSRQRHSGIISQAATFFFKHASRRSFAFSCKIKGQIPPSRGLGGSAAIRLGILHGLNELENRPADPLSIFRFCAELEGHPDNACPASFGGFTVSSNGTIQRFAVGPRLHFVLLIPTLKIKTSSARKVLPRRIAHGDAVTNCGNACAITAAFASGNYNKLRGVFVDYLHQPFRQKLLPFLPRVIAEAEKAGALGAFLSGSGSTICAITLRDANKIGAAMKRAAGTIPAEIIVTAADNIGVRESRIENRK